MWVEVFMDKLIDSAGKIYLTLYVRFVLLFGVLLTVAMVGNVVDYFKHPANGVQHVQPEALPHSFYDFETVVRGK